MTVERADGAEMQTEIAICNNMSKSFVVLYKNKSKSVPLNKPHVSL